jgi:hypothetical protein
MAVALLVIGVLSLAIITSPHGAARPRRDDGRGHGLERAGQSPEPMAKQAESHGPET